MFVVSLQLCNVMFTYELSRRLKAAGSKVIAGELALGQSLIGIGDGVIAITLN